MGRYWREYMLYLLKLSPNGTLPKKPLLVSVQVSKEIDECIRYFWVDPAKLEVKRKMKLPKICDVTKRLIIPWPRPGGPVKIRW